MRDAVVRLARGLLNHEGNAALRSRAQDAAFATEFYRQAVVLTYRLLVMLMARQRGLITEAGGENDPGRGGNGDPLLPPVIGGDDGVGAAGMRGEWARLSAMFQALDAGGHERLRAPALGGYLWSPRTTPDLLGPAQGLAAGAEPVQIDDACVREVVGVLSAALTDADWGPPEVLGSTYEFLLELQPHVHPGAAACGEVFELKAARGQERKKSGSYYTPDRLVQHILDSALEPVLSEAAGRARAEAEHALLAVTVCDPACGSGHFLVAAARRMAHRLAAVREGSTSPSAAGVATAFIEVARRCIYGVDLNQMAVELCKIALWMEAADPALVPTCFDAHIKCGNSLLGATPNLMAAGVPDDAFAPFAGCDNRLATALRRRNKRERSGSQNEATQASTLDREEERLLADAWCSAFFWRQAGPREHEDGEQSDEWAPITDAVYRRMHRAPSEAPPGVVRRVKALAGAHRFFHWHLEFPEVFQGAGDDAASAGSQQTSDRLRQPSGFHVVVGNPPFLNQVESATTIAKEAAAIARLLTGNTAVRYTDLSAMFLLLSCRLLRPGGYACVVQPQSVLSAKAAGPVRRALAQTATLHALWSSSEHVFDASVFTCALTLRLAGPRRIECRRASGPGCEPLAGMPVDMDELERQPTWGHVVHDGSRVPAAEYTADGCVGDLAGSVADFTEYYRFKDFVVEAADLEAGTEHEHPPLITTGLVDLASCGWGRRPTRAFKRRWEAPCLDRGRMYREGTLGPWMDRRRVPKLVVATQTRVIEVLVDEPGLYIASVPLITVMPRDTGMLWHLAAALASPVTCALALRRFAGAALNTDAIKLSAKQVLELPLPKPSPAWNAAADLFHAAASADAGAGRLVLLRRMAKASVEAFEVPLLQRADLLAWWCDRLHRDHPARRGRISSKEADGGAEAV